MNNDEFKKFDKIYWKLNLVDKIYWKLNLVDTVLLIIVIT